MKHNYNVLLSKSIKCLLIAGSLFSAGVFGLNAAITKNFYKSASVLSSSNWVKVGVDKTGVYEIKYSTLRQMGFSDPSQVTVFGRGGRMMPESFVNSSNNPAIEDDLSPAYVLHLDDKLYFYGLGPEEISFVTDSKYDAGGYFQRKSNNIYSFRGYYFLTDAYPVTPMETESNQTSTDDVLIKGVSYIYHEKDLQHNDTDSGQLFWGEWVGLPYDKKISWEVELPDAIAKANGVMNCEIYFPSENFGSSASVSYGFSDPGVTYFTTPYLKTSSYYGAHQPTVAQIQVPGNKGNVFVGFESPDMGDFSNLDFWVVTYQSNIPTFGSPQQKQRLIAFPGITPNATKTLRLKDSASLVVLDVTDERAPKRLALSATGLAGVKSTGATPQILIFDKDVPQYEICGYESAYTKIENQNLHGYAETGADLIIISTPRFMDYAEEIAQLHREHDGIEVIVTTPEEVYNEFSAGVPDPMAYRSFAKMLYLSDRKPKNMLLVGPLFGDFRGINIEHDPRESIIAFQSPSVSFERGAHNINDFYGMMSDKLTSPYERNTVELGVGILPFKFEADARIVVDKIRKHLERTDQAYYLNKITAVGGLGDGHTHDEQIRRINNHVQLLDNYGTIFTPMAIDSYGNSEARKKVFSKFNEGIGIFTYFGHGGEQSLGKNNKFFNTGDVYKLRNTVLPLMGFGGCQITNTDRGYRGIGEVIVTSTPYGALGAVVSARETFSTQNLNFFTMFFTCLFKEGNNYKDPHRYTPATIGEVYAQTRSYETSNNKLAYQLLCDPALVIPTINRPIKVQKGEVNGDLRPGEPFSFTGYVATADNEVDTEFNGELVFRLCEPEKTVPVGNIETGEPSGSLAYFMRDNQISMTTTTVKNGKFEIKMHAPEAISEFEGQVLLMYLCAYDPSTKTGAGSGYSVEMKPKQAVTTESLDKTAPVVEELAFDDKTCAISFTVSDNLALNLSNNPLSKGMALYIDSKELTDAYFIEPVMEQGRSAYSKNIPLEGLSYGDHSARLKVKDAAGNYTEAEIIFTYNPVQAKFVLAKGDESSMESTVILADGLIPEDAKLVILTANGTEIWNGEFKGGRAVWDHIDFNGQKVAPGHYKAYIIETGNAVLKGHSETLDIPVI